MATAAEATIAVSSDAITNQHNISNNNKSNGCTVGAAAASTIATMILSAALVIT